MPEIWWSKIFSPKSPKGCWIWDLRRGRLDCDFGQLSERALQSMLFSATISPKPENSKWRNAGNNTEDCPTGRSRRRSRDRRGRSSRDRQDDGRRCRDRGQNAGSRTLGGGARRPIFLPPSGACWLFFLRIFSQLCTIRDETEPLCILSIGMCERTVGRKTQSNTTRASSGEIM